MSVLKGRGLAVYGALLIFALLVVACQVGGILGIVAFIRTL